jgi:hypothetical protein
MPVVEATEAASTRTDELLLFSTTPDALRLGLDSGGVSGTEEIELLTGLTLRECPEKDGGWLATAKGAEGLFVEAFLAAFSLVCVFSSGAGEVRVVGVDCSFRFFTCPVSSLNKNSFILLRTPLGGVVVFILSIAVIKALNF